jgi:hypothetical protein
MEMEKTFKMIKYVFCSIDVSPSNFNCSSDAW